MSDDWNGSEVEEMYHCEAITYGYSEPDSCTI